MFTNDNAFASEEEDDDDMQSGYSDISGNDDLAGSASRGTSPHSSSASARGNDTNDLVLEGRLSVEDTEGASDHEVHDARANGLSVPPAVDAAVRACNDHDLEEDSNGGLADDRRDEPDSSVGAEHTESQPRPESTTSESGSTRHAVPHAHDGVGMTWDEEQNRAPHTHSSVSSTPVVFSVDEVGDGDLLDEETMMNHANEDGLHAAPPLPGEAELVTNHPPRASCSDASLSSTARSAEPSTPRFHGFTHFAVMTGGPASMDSGMSPSAPSQLSLQTEEAAVRAYLSRYRLVIPSAV